MAGDVLVPSQKISSGEISIHQTLPNSAGEHESLIVPSHPLSIKPAGNAYTATENIKLAAGSFTILPDELLIQVLESLDATSLKRLGCACKALYAFSSFEELWKILCIEYGLLLTLFLTSRCHNLLFKPRPCDLHCFWRRLVKSSSARGVLVPGVESVVSPKNVHIV